MMEDQRPGYLRQGMLFPPRDLQILHLEERPEWVVLQFDTEDGKIQFALLPEHAQKLSTGLAQAADLIAAKASRRE